MNNKIIYFLLLGIIIASVTLIIEVNQTPIYNVSSYSQIYEEYNKILIDENNTTINSIPITNSNTNYFKTYKNASGITYKTIGIIKIPKINVSYPIINDYTEENLNIAPTKIAGPLPNTIGNLCIAAHNNWNRDFFSNLNKLQIGDIVEITDINKNKLEYQVYDIFETNQNDLSILNQDTSKKELTLITCIKFHKQKRLILKCVAK